MHRCHLRNFLSLSETIDTSYRAITISRYGHHLANWLRFFPRKQIFIVESRQVVNNPVKLLFDLEKFLEVEHQIDDSYFVMNKTRGFFCFKDKNLKKSPTSLESPDDTR